MDEKIYTFNLQTDGVNDTTAKFFLDASNGDLKAAVNAFFGASHPSFSPRSPIPNNGPRR